MTEKDLAWALAEFHRVVSWRHQKAQLKYFTVSEILTRETRCFTAETPVATAAQQLLQNQLYGLPVIDVDGSLIGVFSVNEALTLAAQSLPE